MRLRRFNETNLTDNILSIIDFKEVQDILNHYFHEFTYNSFDVEIGDDEGGTYDSRAFDEINDLVISMTLKEYFTNPPNYKFNIDFGVNCKFDENDNINFEELSNRLEPIFDNYKRVRITQIINSSHRIISLSDMGKVKLLNSEIGSHKEGSYSFQFTMDLSEDQMKQLMKLQ